MNVRRLILFVVVFAAGLLIGQAVEKQATSALTADCTSVAHRASGR